MSAPRFAPGQAVTYRGRMLRNLLGRPLVVASAHVKSGIGDPATDDCCMVHDGRGGPEYRVSTSRLRRARA